MQEIKVIDYSIKPEKAKQWHYKLHPYFTKQASNVVREYIKNFSKEKEIVLDPFSGTGVTAIESLCLRRKTIAVDLSPLACFITRESCISPVNLAIFDNEFHNLKAKLQDTVEFARNGKYKEIENYKIKEWYPKGIRLPSNSDFEFVEDLFDKKQLIVYAKLLSEIQKIADIEIRNLLKLVFASTISRVNLTYWLSTTRGENRLGDGGPSIFGAFRYAKPSKLVVLDVWVAFERRFNSTFKAKKESNKFIGNFFSELNFQNKGLKKIDNSNGTFIVFCDSACELTKYLPEQSIDYIYTDPPYGAHIAYLDLSTMWNEWLEFKVTEKMRNQEAIEGGELKKSKSEYKGLIFNSIEQMAKVLKPDKYLSLVFQHKEVEFWNMILESCEKSGFQYVNTVYQPTNTTSIHKKKNPLKVMGSQLIINFKRSNKKIYSSIITLKDESQIEKIILDTAERVIIEKGGYCVTEDIYASVVPKLMESGLLDLANKRYKDLIPLLEKNFTLDNQGNWQIKKGTTIGSYIDKKMKIEYYLRSIFKRQDKVNLDDLIGTVFPNLTNGVTPTNEEFMEVLERVAESEGEYWRLKDKKNIVQLDLDFNIKIEIPRTTEHNQVIFRLAILAQKLNLIPFIGKQEQQDKNFDKLKFVKNVQLINVRKEDLNRIEQIDCIWFYKDFTPAFAFEVEESTSILSALERFYSLLKIVPEIAHNKRLVIIAPQNRKKKLEKELKTSSYIGAPNYLDKKVKYLYKEEFCKNYERLMRAEVELKDIDRMLTDINID